MTATTDPGPPGAPGADRAWMLRAVELSRRCPPSATAFSVGAVLVGVDGAELSTGFSREGDPVEHAEEAAFRKLPGDARLAGATLYSTLEPCSQRASRPVPCARLVLDAGVRRVVIAWREPPLLVEDCVGAELLVAGGAEVVELPELATAARAANVHLLNG